MGVPFVPGAVAGGKGSNERGGARAREEKGFSAEQKGKVCVCGGEFLPSLGTFRSPWLLLLQHTQKSGVIGVGVQLDQCTLSGSIPGCGYLVSAVFAYSSWSSAPLLYFLAAEICWGEKMKI